MALIQRFKKIPWKSTTAGLLGLTVAGSTSSLNSTSMVKLVGTFVAPSVGRADNTVGGVGSGRTLTVQLWLARLPQASSRVLIANEAVRFFQSEDGVQVTTLELAVAPGGS